MSTKVVVEIPVTQNLVGDEVHVRIATTDSNVMAPDTASSKWQVIAKVANEDLPTTVETSPRPRGFYVWYQGAAFENGTRVSNWSVAQVIEVPQIIAFTEYGLFVNRGGPPHVITWTPTSLTGGVRIRWSVDEIGTDPALDNTLDVDASTGSQEIAASVSSQEMLTVELEPWSEFSAGSVAGEAGDAVQIQDNALGDTPTLEASLENLGCLFYMDEDFELYVMDDDSYCLVTDSPREV